MTGAARLAALWLLAAFAAGCATTAPTAPVSSSAMTALRKGDARTAEEILRRGAAEGNVNSMKLLGAMLESGINGNEGQGVAANPREALEWYRKASETGDIEAAKREGILVATGRGTAADPQEALEIFRRAGVDVDSIGALRELPALSKAVRAWMVASYVDIALRVQLYPKEALRRGDSGSVTMRIDTVTRTVDVIGGTASDHLKSVVREIASRSLILVPPPEEASRARLKTEIQINYQLGG